MSDDLLRRLKANRTKVGKGEPNNSEGSSGDFTLRQTTEGIILYVKYVNKWYRVGRLKSVGGRGQGIIEGRHKVSTNEVVVEKTGQKTTIVPEKISTDGDITLDTDGGQVYIKDDGASHFLFDCDNTKMTIYDDTTASDFFYIQTSANGATKLVTFDNDGAAGHLSLEPDGHIILTVLDAEPDAIEFKIGSNRFGSLHAEDGASSTFRLYEMGGESNDDLFKLYVEEHGATTLQTIDDNAAAAHLTLDPDGDLVIKPANNTGQVTIDKNSTNTTTAINTAMQIDHDHTGISASGQTIRNIGLDLDMNCETVTHVGTMNQTGIDIDLVAATDGSQTNTGIAIDVDGADTNVGLLINTAGTHIKLEANADTSDYAEFKVADTGDLAITTTGSGTTDSFIELNADGPIFFTSASNTWTFQESDGTDLIKHSSSSDGAKTEWFHGTGATGPFIHATSNRGAATLGTVDASGVNAGDLTLAPQGKVIVDANVGGLYIEEDAAAAGDVSTYGQIWVKNSTPNELYFTTDAGDDIQLTSGTSAAGGGGTVYHYQQHAFYATSTTNVYIPFGPSAVESSSTSTALIDDTFWIAPYAGKLVKAYLYAKIGPDETDLKLRVNGTLGSSMLSGGAVDADNNSTVYSFDCDQNNTFSAGDVINVLLEITTGPNQTTMTTVWELD